VEVWWFSTGIGVVVHVEVWWSSVGVVVQCRCGCPCGGVVV